MKDKVYERLRELVRIKSWGQIEYKWVNRLHKENQMVSWMVKWHRLNMEIWKPIVKGTYARNLNSMVCFEMRHRLAFDELYDLVNSIVIPRWIDIQHAISMYIW